MFRLGTPDHTTTNTAVAIDSAREWLEVIRNNAMTLVAVCNGVFDVPPRDPKELTKLSDLHGLTYLHTAEDPDPIQASLILVPLANSIVDLIVLMRNQGADGLFTPNDSTRQLFRAALRGFGYWYLQALSNREFANGVQLYERRDWNRWANSRFLNPAVPV